MINEEQIENMLHALGLTSYGLGRRRRWAFRNYYVATKSSKDFLLWQESVQEGLARERQYSDTCSIFSVTLAGIDFLGEDIKKRTPLEIRKKAQ